MDDILIKHKDMLITAYTKKYIHGLSSSLTAELFKIAEKLGLKSGSITCPKCVLKTCANLGKYILEQELEQKTPETAPDAILGHPETPKTQNNIINKEAKKKAPERKTKKSKK